MSLIKHAAGWGISLEDTKHSGDIEDVVPPGGPRSKSQRIASLATRTIQSTPLLACVLAALTWSYSKTNLLPGAGIDNSWQGSLDRDAALGMHFGTQVVFTYGPLGFLTVPNLYETGAALAAFVFAVALAVALFWVLLRALRPVMPLPLAVVLAYVAGASVTFTDFELEMVLAFALVAAVGILSGERADEGRTEWIALGVLLGVFSLVKISVGAGVLGIAIVTLALLPTGRVRALRSFIPAAVLTFAAGWFGMGNGFSNIVPYLVHSIPIVTGYSSAMSISPLGVTWQPWLALAVVALVAIVAWAHCRPLARRQQVGIALVTLLSLWLLAKEAFARLTLGHLLAFFAFVPILLVAFRPPRFPRIWLTTGLMAAVVLSYVVSGSIPNLAYRPDLAVRNLGGEALTLASGSQRHRVMALGRATMQAAYGVPPALLARMRGHTVDVDPWEQNVTWAYPGSIFDPLPVIQDYSAYTSSLDHLDASYLATAEAPSLILREAGVSVDGRLPIFDPPLTQVEMECRYRQVAASPVWQLTADGKDRCGSLQKLSTEKTTESGGVRVPTARPDEIVVATFDIPYSLSWNLEGLLLKPPEICMSTVQAGGTKASYRFITGTATDIHLLRPAATLGYSPPFVPPAIDSLALSVCGAHTSIVGVKVSFYEIAMRSGA